MTEVRSRKYFLDLLRIVACFLVIVNHTNSRIFQGSNPEHTVWFVSLTYFFVSKIAVPVFFMISGYLLLSKVDTWKKAFNRFLRIVIVVVGCSIAYAIYRACYVNHNASFSVIMKDALTGYYKSPTNALWYLYAYMGILLMLPLLQKMASVMTKKDYHVYFAISGCFVSLLPILTHYFPEIKLHSQFQLPLFTAYIGMLMIGQYFARYEIKKTKLRFVVAVAIFIAMVAFNVIATYFEYQKNSKKYLFFDNRTFLPIIVQSVCAFYLAMFVELPAKVGKIISYVGSCTFGIYIVSDMTIGFLLPEYNKAIAHVHPLFAIVVLEICVFVFGLIAVSILKKVPLVKKVL